MAVEVITRQAAIRKHKLTHLHPNTGLAQQVQDGHFGFSERAAFLIPAGNRAMGKRRTHTDEQIYERINDVHAKKIRRDYITQENHHPSRFWENSLRKSDEFIYDVIDTLFPHRKNAVELTDEVRLMTATPAEMLAEMADRSDAGLARYRFELQRKRFIAGLVAGLRSQSHEHQQEAEVLKIHKMLDNELFLDGKKTHTSISYAVQENATGKVLGISTQRPDPASLQPDTHVRIQDSQARRIRVRETEEILDVESHIREKPTASSVGKLLRYAVESPNGNINPEVNDIKGVQLNVKGVQSSFDPKVTYVANRTTDLVVKFLKKEYGDSNVRVEVDDRNGNPEHPGQSNTIHYQRRIIHVNGRHPMELMFYGEGDYIDSENNVGHFDPTTGFYDGGARELFKIKRYMLLLPHLFPEEIEGQRIEAFSGLAKEAYLTYMRKAQELLAKR